MAALGAPGVHAGRPLLSRHLRLQQGLERPRACSSAPMRAMQRRGSSRLEQRAPDDAAEERRRGADAGLDRREGDRRGADRGRGRRRVRQPAAHRHAAADRPDRDLRPGHGVRRQPAQARPAGRHAVQHLHPRRPAADADRDARQGGAARRGAARRRPRRCTSSRAATAAANSARRSTSTTARSTSTSAGRQRRDAAADSSPSKASTAPASRPTSSRWPSACAPQGRAVVVHARAGRHAARRAAARAAAARADGRADRGAADVRGAPRPIARVIEPALARGDVGAVRPLHRCHLRLPGRAAAASTGACSTQLEALGAGRACSPT